MSERPMLKLIVAACEGNGIGKSGTLPWTLRSELSYFARQTKSVKDPSKMNAVIMGRKTWESIPAKFRPLKQRFNIVLTTRESLVDNDDVSVCKNFNEALELVDKMADDNKIESCWIIGGSSVYQEAMTSQRLKRIYLTKILHKFECDTFLLSIDLDSWELIKEDGVSEELQEENGINYKYLVYNRIIKN